MTLMGLPAIINRSLSFQQLHPTGIYIHCQVSPIMIDRTLLGVWCYRLIWTKLFLKNMSMGIMSGQPQSEDSWAHWEWHFNLSFRYAQSCPSKNTSSHSSSTGTNHYPKTKKSRQNSERWITITESSSKSKCPWKKENEFNRLITRGLSKDFVGI